MRNSDTIFIHGKPTTIYYVWFGAREATKGTTYYEAILTGGNPLCQVRRGMDDKWTVTPSDYYGRWDEASNSRYSEVVNTKFATRKASIQAIATAKFSKEEDNEIRIRKILHQRKHYRSKRRSRQCYGKTRICQ